MPKRKWIGHLIEDLNAIGGWGFKKGDKVICWKKRFYEEDFHGGTSWHGRFQYHYSYIDGTSLVRTTKFLIQEFNEPNL